MVRFLELVSRVTGLDMAQRPASGTLHLVASSDRDHGPGVACPSCRELELTTTSSTPILVNGVDELRHEHLACGECHFQYDRKIFIPRTVPDWR